ncbi:MAG: phosphatase PAP2 family protein [Cytophagales bacterium]|nr:phosphatase PAP2 family protein [Bernardetiaceae bacterium]MDW8205458.1 phosphatase PAP2 family protein [Cytophagales bacterium]
MKVLNELLRRNNGFLLPLGLILIGVGGVLLWIPKGDEVIYINRWHHPVADILFRYVTHLGDGWFAVVVAIALLWVRFRHSIQILLAWGISGLIVQLLKMTFFAGMPRPAAYFGEWVALHYVEGVAVHMTNSFPSGHAATAFAVFLSLSIMLQGRHVWGAFACFLLATAAAFSRVYLVQHFGADVWVGACIGTLTAIYVGYQMEQPARWFNRPFWQTKL